MKPDEKSVLMNLGEHSDSEKADMMETQNNERKAKLKTYRSLMNLEN